MPSRRWTRMAEMYRRFTDEGLDFSEQAAQEMYAFESRGVGGPARTNGFARGKAVMDLTVAMWREDIAYGLLRREELDYPEWFLRRTLTPNGR